MINIGRRTIGIAVAAAAFVASAPPATAQRTATRIEGNRYATLRSLATYVDNGAEFTLEEARRAIGTSRDRRERALMNALRNFQVQSRRFRTRIDDYERRPWRLDTELTRLRNAARNVNTQLSRVPAMRDVTEDWNLVIQDINDMTRIAGGSDVTLRRASDRWERRNRMDDRRDDGNFGDTLRGQRLDDFRRLSRELDVAAREAYNRARNQRADYTGAGVQLLRDLEHFAQQAAQVRSQADGRDVRPRDIDPIITHLLEDARRADTSMRNARVYSTVWNEWADVIRTLEQMSPLVRMEDRRDDRRDDRDFGDTLRGQRLDDFRRLSRELDVAAREAYNRARNQRADYSGAGVQLLRDLENFAQEAARVRAEVDARDIRPRDINPTITRLLEDARRADTSMRNARVYPTVWNEWSDVIRKLEQMMPLVR